MMGIAEANDFPPPTVFGFPDKFDEWRANQVEAVMGITNDEDHRFSALVCPTGFGKSITYVAAAVLGGYRTLFLTSSKGLQSQLLQDFEEMGMVDIRGRGNYRCIAAGDGSMCDHGPCVVGVKCNYKENGQCLYYRALSDAVRSNLVVSNYAFWMASNEYAGSPLGNFHMIVCDEGHGLPDVVCDHLTVNFDKYDHNVKRIMPDLSIVSRFTLAEWREWGKGVMRKLDKEVEEMGTAVKHGDRHSRREFVRAKALLGAVAKVAHMGDDWVVDVGEREVTFAPVWPASYMEEYMWRKCGKVVITSATLCHKTLEMVGVDQEAIYSEYPHSFPLANRRLIHIPTVQMNHRNEANTDYMRAWISRIDQIIGARLDRKGIVHTVSYGRRDLLLTRSRHRDIFITHKRLDTESQVRMFKGMGAPAVLVSPSMATGWDFPDDECRYQVIGKLSYPDTRNRITKARCNGDPDYGAYIAMQQLVQAVGRGVRSKKDWCESFIIDDNIGWFMRRYGRTFAPEWFRLAMVRGDGVIPTPRRMEVAD